MSELAQIVERTERFIEAVRHLKLPSPSRHAKLMPLKDGVVELRQEGASLLLIRELFATVGVGGGNRHDRALSRRGEWRTGTAANV